MSVGVLHNLILDPKRWNFILMKNIRLYMRRKKFKYKIPTRVPTKLVYLLRNFGNESSNFKKNIN